MRQTITIATADHVEVEFDLAGLGSRFAAYLIDLCCMAVLAVLLILLLLASGLAPALLLRSDTWTGNALASWMLATVLLLLFLVQWGYFVCLEGLWRGQTPGKMALGIRVVRHSGVPITLREAALRNLVRAADMLPPPTYLLAGAVMHFDQYGRRLGDLVAGTIVVREIFGAAGTVDAGNNWSATWIARLEQGKSGAVTLPQGALSVEQLGLVAQFLQRRHTLPPERRRELARQIVAPLLPLLDGTPGGETAEPERLLEVLLQRARTATAGAAQHPAAATAESAKHQQWQSFQERAMRLVRGRRRRLRALSPAALSEFIAAYRHIATDLARGRSLGADTATLLLLNRLVGLGHSVLYGYVKTSASLGVVHWLRTLPRLVRTHGWAVGLAAALLFGPALCSYVALQWSPELAYDMVGEDFLSFTPTDQEHLHRIPSLWQPVAASAIITNNLQVSLLAFGLGLTAGLGTVLVLLFNGVYLGAVFGWLGLQGYSRALWGWVMPHGATELLAIVLSGAAGLLLAQAIVAPGEVSRAAALKRIAPQALQIEFGCIGMLLMAGLIEGFVSPSPLNFAARVVVLLLSVTGWVLYLGLVGRGGRTIEEE